MANQMGFIKIRFLLTHGYILVPLDLVLVNGQGFSSQVHKGKTKVCQYINQEWVQGRT